MDKREIRRQKSQHIISQLLFFILFTLLISGCNQLGLITETTSTISEETQGSDGTALPLNTVEPTAKAVPERDIINKYSASSLVVADGMVQSGSSDFVWASNLELEIKGLALSSEEQVSMFSIDPPSDAGQIPDDNPSMLTSAYEGGIIAWKNSDESVRVWDFLTNEELLSLEGGDGALTGLALSSGGDYLAVSTFDNRVEIWDVSKNQRTMIFDSMVWLSNLEFSPDEALLSGVDAPNFVVRIYDTQTGVEVQNYTWTDHASPALYGAYFSPEWDQLAWVARGSIQIMDPENGELGPLLSHEDFISATAWSPDGSTIASAAAGTLDGEFASLIYIWDPLTGELINRLVMNEPVTTLSFSPDGRELAVLSTSGALQIWVVEE